MQFSKLLVAATAFVAAQAVEFTDPAGSFSEITAGKTFNFTWADASGDVTLTLKNGPATNLQTVSVIQSGLTGNSYVWSVPSTLAADTYAVQIDDSTGTPNYSPLFQLIGGVTSSSSVASSTTSGSSSSTGSSSTSGASTTSTGSSTTSTGSSSSSSSTGSTSASKTTSTGSSSTGSKTTSATGSTSSTSAPSSAAGVSSPLAFVFLVLAAFFTLN